METKCAIEKCDEDPVEKEDLCYWDIAWYHRYKRMAKKLEREVITQREWATDQTPF